MPESGWAQTYGFDGKRGTITLGYPDGSEFAYGFDGNFVERDLWLDWQLKQGHIWVVEAELERLGETVPPQLLERMLCATAISLNSQSAGTVNNRAAANRVRGLCLERKGDSAAALRSYEAALALDPKVGVKRRADALRKRI